MAQIQIHSSPLVNQMQFFGMSRQSFGEFAAGVEAILEELLALQSSLDNKLTSEEEGKIASLLPLAVRDCDELAKCGLPDALVHGDPNESNIFCEADGRTTLIDWAFSRVTHPFFVLKGLCWSMGAPKHRMHHLLEQAKDAYLNSWQEYSPRRQLIKGLDAASRLMWIESTHHLAKFFRYLKEEEPGNLLLIPRMVRQALAAYGLSTKDKGRIVN
jgi:thiamine kinase-like enzyme